MMLIDWLLLNLHNVQLFNQNADCCLVIDHMHIHGQTFDLGSMGDKVENCPNYTRVGVTWFSIAEYILATYMTCVAYVLIILLC